MTTLELEKLRIALPKNWKSTLATRTGFSDVYVWEVLNGKKNNLIIIDAAISLAKEEKAIREERQQQIDSL